MKRKNGLIIAVDGPAGSGKSTVSRMAAGKLNYLYVDTGAMYRALTWKALHTNTGLMDEAGLIKLAKRTSIKLEKGRKVFVDGIDVTDDIRNPEVTNEVHRIANIPEIRECMVTLQRKMGEEGGVVLEGRDIGTVVFPDADRKIYLDAEIKERARRRHAELEEHGHSTRLNDVEEEMHRRDETDKGRKVAPLRIAGDAVVIDTTHMNISQVVETILTIAKG